MKTQLKSALARVVRDESGQTLPFMALCIILFLGMAGLTIDVGHAYVSYQELQTSTDAAALAAGYAMASSTATLKTVQAAATSYSSATGGSNVDSGMLPGVGITTTPVCLAAVTWVNCGATVIGDYNAVQVVQTMTAPTVFMKALNAFGIKTSGSIPLSTIAIASMRGAANAQYNVALVIDTTSSSGDTDPDSNCSVVNSKGKTVTGTELQCSLQGAEVLLNSLTPCGQGSTSTTCTSAFDSVALFTFPNVSYNTVAGDYSCTTTTPASTKYSVPSISPSTPTTYAPSGTQPTYEVTFGAGSPASTTGFLDDYSTTNAYNGGVNTTSPWGIALGLDTGTNCNGLQSTGGQGTYLAGAIYAAMGALTAAQKANPGSQNAMIILTDGDAPGTNLQSGFVTTSGTAATLNDTVGTSLGLYPSLYDQCEQAVTAANTASKASITVYTVAYNSPTSGGCASDVYNKTIQTSGANPNGSGIQPCTELQDMATTAADFYSDATTADGGSCTSSVNPNLTLNQVFQSVATSFTKARLIAAN